MWRSFTIRPLKQGTSQVRAFRAYTEWNINATQFCSAAKNAKHLKRLVFASTSWYRNLNQPTSRFIATVSPYGITQVAAERLCCNKNLVFLHSIALLHGLWSRNARIYVSQFFKSVLISNPTYGDGKTRSDAIAANLAAATVPAAIGQIFNIGGGSRVVAEVIDTIEKSLACPIRKHIERDWRRPPHSGTCPKRKILIPPSLTSGRLE